MKNIRIIRSLMLAISLSFVLFSAFGQSSYCDTITYNINLPDTTLSCDLSSTILTAPGGFAGYNWSNGQSGLNCLASYSGLYFITVTDDSSCVHIDSVYVSLMNAQIVEADTFLCYGDGHVINLSTNHPNFKSADFDGSSSYAVFPDSGMMTGNAARAIDCWIFNEGHNSEATIISYGNSSGNQSFKLSINANEYLKLYLNQLVYTSSIQVPQNSWTHIVVNTTSNLKYGFYIDGIAAGSGSIIGTYNTVLAGNVALGYLSGISSSHFNGKLDEFKVWDGDISTEVLSIFPFIHLNGQSNPELAFYWDFNYQYAGYYYDVIKGQQLSTSSILQEINVPFANYKYLLDGVSGYFTSYTTAILPLSTEDYIAYFYDGIGSCPDTISVQVAHPPDLQDTIKVCNTDTVFLNTSFIFSNYLWNTGVYTSELVVLETGLYTLTVSESVCIMFDSSFVSMIDVEILQPDTMLCLGDTITLSASSSANNYYWSTDDATSTISYGPTSSGFVNVTSADAYQNCIASIYVDVNPLPLINIPLELNTCNQNEALITQIQETGSAYLWNTGDTSNYLIADTSDIYTITVTNQFGCSSEGSSNVNLYTLTILEEDTFICNAQALVLSLESNVSGYQWSNGAATSSISITPLTSGIYSVLYQQVGFSCSDSVFVEVSDPIIINLTDSVTTCDTSIVTLDVTPGYDNYGWSSGSVSSSATFILSGDYTLTVTDSIGCTIVDSVFISLIDAELFDVDSLICAGESILLNTNSAGYEYLWNTGDTAGLIFQNPEVSTYYEVTVSNGFSTCIYGTQVQVNEVVTGLIYGETSFIASDTAHLYYINSNPGSSYEWFISGGVYDASQIYNDSIYVVWDNEGTGYVSVIETDSMACVGQPVELEIVILDLDEVNVDQWVSIYPNPCNSFLNIRIVDVNDYSIYEIYNMPGKLLLQKRIVEQKDLRIDVRELAPGPYQIRLSGIKSHSFLFIIDSNR
jgi:hypothetical protein